MHSDSSSKRRRRDVQLATENLETRALLTGGAGNTFAIVPGDIATADQPAAVKFTIDANNFTLPRGKLALGVDIAAASGSTVKPLISSIDDSSGNIVPQTFHSVYDPRLPRKAVATGSATSAVITPVTYHPTDPAAPSEYTVNVSAIDQSTGKFLVGFYLPGDANGDGSVDQSDVKAVRAAMNSKAGDSRYTFDADANRDGRIGRIDLTYTQQNLGAKTVISPVVSANLAAESDTGVQDRVTTLRDVTFSGAASPNAKVTFSDLRAQVSDITTTTDAKGNYSVAVKLADGPNTFKVTTQDGFGQSITGVIAPVTYNNASPITPADIQAMRDKAATGNG